MLGCKRDADDPLIKAFLRDHGINLVRWPRDGIELGQVLIEKPNGSVAACELGEVFAGTPPRLPSNPKLRADLSSKFSNKVDAKLTVRLLDHLASAFGTPARARLDAAYGGASTVRVRVRNVTVDAPKLKPLRSYVAEATLRPDQVVYDDGDRIFVTVGVATATAIEVVGYDKDGGKVKVDLDATGLGGVGAAFQAIDEGADAVTYKGRKPLAFGVQLLEIRPRPPGWELVEQERPVSGVRGGDDDAVRPENCAFLSGPEGDAAFDWPS